MRFDPSDRSTFFGSFGDLLTESLTGCSRLSVSLTAEDADQLRATCKKIADTNKSLSETPTYRPNVETLNLGVHAAKQIRRIVDLYLQAMMAELPLEAQLAGNEAQRILDFLADGLISSQAEIDILDTLQRGNYLDEGGLNLLDAVGKMKPGQSLLELDQHGRDELRKIIGFDPDNPGSGLTYLMLDLLATHHFDIAAYRSKLSLAAGLLKESRSNFEGLFDDELFRADIAAAQSRALRLNVRIDRVLRGGLSDEMVLQELVDTYGEIAEHLGLPASAFALYLSGRKSGKYGNLRREDVGTLATWCLETEVARDLMGGFSKPLRNAAHHAGGYRIVNGMIELTLRSSAESYTIDQFLNILFELLESCQALLFLAQASLPTREGDTPTASLFEGMSLEQRAAFTLRSCGATGVDHIELVDETWEAHIDQHGPGLLLLCRAIAPFAPSSSTHVKVLADNGSRFVSVPITALRTSLEIGTERPRDVLDLILDARSNDGPIATRALVRQMALLVAVSEDPTEAIPNLKAFRSAARRLGDEELEEGILSAIQRFSWGDEKFRGTPEAAKFKFWTQLTVDSYVIP